MFYKNFIGDVFETVVYFGFFFIKTSAVQSLLACIYYYFEGEECLVARALLQPECVASVLQ